MGIAIIGSLVGISRVGLADQNEAVSTGSVSAQSAISAGGTHACVVSSSGVVSCWGGNGAGQGGTASGGSPLTTPTTIAALSNVVAVTNGGEHSCALETGGAIKCWGANYEGRLGNGNTTSGPTPEAVVGATAQATSISAGGSHTCAVLATHELACWGRGDEGQIGQNVASRSTAGIVPGLSNDIEAVSAGGSFTCALHADGDVTCFGSNQNGESGVSPTISQTGPASVTGFGSETAVAIATGQAHACAVLSDGSVACWGRNWTGQLGVSGPDSYVATVVPGVSAAIAVSAAGDHTCALTSTGAALCWGSNSSGQLGDGTFTNSSSPVAVSGGTIYAAITTGNLFTCGVSLAGQVDCWGENSSWQLGRGGSQFTSSPTQVTGLPTGVAKVAGGRAHTCAAYTNGDLRCWGLNDRQQVVPGSQFSVPNPTLVSGVTSNGVTVTSMGLGYQHTCVGLSDGTAKCWGRNDLNQLGRGDTVDSGVPTSPSGLGNVQVARVFAHANGSCLISTAGDAMCWGRNYFGQLGVGDNNDRSTPTAVVGMTGLTVVDIAMGNWHTCFMYTDGVMSGHGVKCVGRNIVRMLGTGQTTDPTFTPTDVVGLTSGVVDIEAGMWHTCAVMSDQTLQCWGNSGVGELGNGTNTRLEIAAAVPNLAGVNKVVIGDRHTCIVDTGSAMKCWGANGSGQLGLGDQNNRNIPVALTAMSAGVTEMAAGGEDQFPGHTCALRSGAVFCWGSDSDGQSGLGFESKTANPGPVVGALSVTVNWTPPSNQSPQIPVFAPPSSSQPPTTTPPAPARPDADMVVAAPTVEVGVPNVVFPGQPITVAYGGFTPGATVDAYFASIPQLAGSAVADANGRVELAVTVPAGLVGEHSFVLYESSTGRLVRQAISIVPLTLPVTGSSNETTDLLVTLALFFIVLGVLGLRKDAGRPIADPEHREM